MKPEESKALKALANAETPSFGWTGDYIEAACRAVPALIKHLERARELLEMHQNYSPEAWRATDAYLREAGER